MTEINKTIGEDAMLDETEKSERFADYMAYASMRSTGRPFKDIAKGMSMTEQQLIDLIEEFDPKNPEFDDE